MTTLFKKGDTKKGGRQKGTPNKRTAVLKDMILHTLDKAGGEAYLLQIAEDDPKTFIALLGKVLPLQVTGSKEDPLVIKTILYDGSIANA